MRFLLGNIEGQKSTRNGLLEADGFLRRARPSLCRGLLWLDAREESASEKTALGFVSRTWHVVDRGRSKHFCHLNEFSRWRPHECVWVSLAWPASAKLEEERKLWAASLTYGDLKLTGT